MDLTKFEVGVRFSYIWVSVWVYIVTGAPSHPLHVSSDIWNVLFGHCDVADGFEGAVIYRICVSISSAFQGIVNPFGKVRRKRLFFLNASPARVVCVCVCVCVCVFVCVCHRIPSPSLRIWALTFETWSSDTVIKQCHTKTFYPLK